MTGQPIAKLQSIQAMRGIAALLVVIFHISTLSRIAGTARSQELGAIWDRGFAGVDMFFVISGFIMVYVTQNLRPTVKNYERFIWSRLSRIYPLWWIYAFAMMAYFYIAYGQPASPDVTDSDGVLPYVLKSIFLIPQEFEPVLGVGWTLIHEMMFYILFAFGLLFPRKFLPVWLMIWAAIIAGAAMLGPQPIHAKTYPQLLISPLNIEFVLGALVGIWLTQDKGKSSGIFLWIGAALFIGAMIIHLPGKGSEFNWQRVAAYGVPSAMMILGAVVLEREGRLKIPGFLVRLGDWSYSLYLGHFLVLLAIRRIWQMVNDKAPGTAEFNAQLGLHTALFVVLGMTLAILVSAISYYLLERPVAKLLKRE